MALSALLEQRKYDLPTLVRVVRGETEADPRPNKALCFRRIAGLLTGYEHSSLLCDIAAHGIHPTWITKQPRQGRVVANHQSANRHLNAVIRSIRSGQDAGQYLVLNQESMNLLPDVHVSPLGAVPKKGVNPHDEIRLIHDLSFPRGASTNDAAEKSLLPVIRYRHVAAVAERIEACFESDPSCTIHILKGDVKGAFRHLMMHSSHIRWMGARLPQLKALVLDMAAPFGWTGSPSYYGVFGGGITWIVGRECPASISDGALLDNIPFFAYEWVDDHIMVEPATPGRLDAAATTLRLAMMAVLGPRAINEAKFSPWSTRLEVLGLEFDTANRTVSMPADKIQKALQR
ncbi:hypothetical protein BBJ28_00024183, partial [Nothophytophthora sp. Chile5]